MMCSPKELGLAADAEGLLILPADAKVGQPFAEHLGRTGDDVIYDLEVTPNRPDLNSVIGINFCLTKSAYSCVSSKSAGHKQLLQLSLLKFFWVKSSI
jgi:hypothetical protein